MAKNGTSLPTKTVFQFPSVTTNENPVNGKDKKRDVDNRDIKIWSRKAGQHEEVGHKSLLRNDALYQYILETSVYPREHTSLRELREATAKHSWFAEDKMLRKVQSSNSFPILRKSRKLDIDIVSIYYDEVRNHACNLKVTKILQYDHLHRNFMATSPDEGQFIALLLKLMNAKNTLELGVYTGYSLLCTALALPADGKIIAIDINRDFYNIGAPYIEEAGVAHKIDFREGPALATLETLLSEDKHHGFFDFIFVDADKNNYINYHPHLLKLVRKGGVIGYDNTLWNGAVIADDAEPMPKYLRYYKNFVCDLNKALAGDSRIEISQLAISDGITLCRRVS